MHICAEGAHIVPFPVAFITESSLRSFPFLSAPLPQFAAERSAAAATILM